jgi:hypothetical protein
MLKDSLKCGKDSLEGGKDSLEGGKDSPGNGKDSLRCGIKRLKRLGTGKNAVYSASAKIRRGPKQPFSSTNVLMAK